MTPQEIEKLFDGAPEGTTHYVEGSIAPFEKREGDDWSFWDKCNNRWELVSSSGDARIRESTFKIIQRQAKTIQSAVDWDKAPEGATHFTPACDADGTNAVFWRVIEGSVVNAWAVFKSGDLKEISINRLLDLSRPDLLARPSPSWIGEGLPPVGVECEHLEDGKGGWKPVRVIAIDRDLSTDTAYIIYHGDNGYSGDSRVGLFRPIRTPEQIAADEREAAILQMLKDAGRPDTAKTRDQAQLLYDAGWRKQPKT